MSKGLYNPSEFKDNCGFGLVAHLKNKPTHQNLEDAVESLSRMMHRGAIAADGKSGDGSGLLFGFPDKFLRKVASKEGIDLPDIYGIGVIFTKDDSLLKVVEEKLENNDLKEVSKILEKEALLIAEEDIKSIEYDENNFKKYENKN